jgi:hypothetical protein
MIDNEIVWYYLDIYNQLSIFKCKINSLTIGLRINKPNYRNIFSTNYKLNFNRYFLF